MATAKKKPAAGAGRVSSSEPRVQVFTKFAGCNFELSPRDAFFNMDYNYYQQKDQTDLAQNYMVVQHNAQVDSNGSIEVVQPWRRLGYAGEAAEAEYASASICVGKWLYVSVKDDIAIDIYEVTSSDAEEEPDLEPAWQLRITDADEEGIHAQTLAYDPEGDWITDFEYVNDMLVAKTYNGLSLVGFIYDEFDGHNDDPPVLDFYLFEEGINDPIATFELSNLAPYGDIVIDSAERNDRSQLILTNNQEPLGGDDYDSQLWVAEKVADTDIYRFRNYKSGFYMQASNTSSEDNWVVETTLPETEDLEYNLAHWRVRPMGAAYDNCSILASMPNENWVNDRKVLNIKSSGKAVGSKAIVFAYNSAKVPTDNELWDLEKISDPDPSYTPTSDDKCYHLVNKAQGSILGYKGDATGIWGLNDASTANSVWNQLIIETTDEEDVVMIRNCFMRNRYLTCAYWYPEGQHGHYLEWATAEAYPEGEDNYDKCRKWKMIESEANPGWYRFQNMYLTDEYLDSNGDGAPNKWTISYENNGGNDMQLWKFVELQDSLEDGAVYKFKPRHALAEDMVLTFDPEGDASICNRMVITLSANGEFGSTVNSEPYVFFTNKPWAIWTYDDYIDITGNTDDFFESSERIKSVDLYFTVDDAQEYIWAYRYEFPGDELVGHSYPYNGGEFTIRFDWTAGDASKWSSVPLRPANQNYTSGPLARYLQILDNRLWYWGSPTVNRERIWIGGNIGNQLTCNPYLGGGWVDCESGHGNRVEAVTKYKTQSGNDIITALVSNPNTGKDLRFNMVETNVSLSQEQTMRTWQAEQVAGAIGVRGHMGTVVCQDGLYTVSTYGVALTTLTMEYNSQIVANYVSDAIKPAFTDFTAEQLRYAQMLHIDGILYLWLPETELLFCYDIGLKAWWTVELPSDITKEQVRHLVSVDFEGEREGLGLVSDTGIYVMGTTMDFGHRELLLEHDVHIESGELGTKQPIQAWQHVTQFEFNFDYFMGECWIDVIGIDRFGRTIVTTKHVDTWVGNETGPKMYSCIYKHTVYMRVDETFESYKIRIRSFNEVQDAEDRLHVDHVKLPVNFRLTHFQAKIYPKSSKIGIMYGFDDRQSFTRNHMFPQAGDIHPIFRNYEDIRKAVLP